MKMYMANWNKRRTSALKRGLTTAAFLLLLLTGAHAQEKTATPKDSLPEQFDATDRAFIKRYRYPDAVPFERKDWKSHTYISLFGGIDKILPRSHTSFNVGPTGGVAVGTQLSRAHGVRLSLYGGRSVEDVRRLSFDQLFLGVTAFQSSSGFMCGSDEDAVLKRACIERADQTIVLMDSSKVGRRSTFQICDLDAVDVVVSDGELPHEFLRACDNADVKVI